MRTVKIIGMQNGDAREIFHQIPLPDEALSLLVKKLLQRPDIDMVVMEQEKEKDDE